MWKFPSPKSPPNEARPSTAFTFTNRAEKKFFLNRGRNSSKKKSSALWRAWSESSLESPSPMQRLKGYMGYMGYMGYKGAATRPEVTRATLVTDVTLLTHVT